MFRRVGTIRAPLLALGLLALVALVAIPAFAADPSNAPGASSDPGKPDKGPKASKEPEVAVTLRGVVGTTTDADGATTYTLTVDGKTVRLDAGPAWFHGDKHPLKGHVGSTVTISGGQHGDEVDVETINGVRLREPGKPPWAGGWKAVGSAHPGWTQEKADRWRAKQAERAAKHGAGAVGCWPRGHCKDLNVDDLNRDSSESPAGG